MTNKYHSWLPDQRKYSFTIDVLTCLLYNVIWFSLFLHYLVRDQSLFTFYSNQIQLIHLSISGYRSLGLSSYPCYLSLFAMLFLYCRSTSFGILDSFVMIGPSPLQLDSIADNFSYFGSVSNPVIPFSVLEGQTQHLFRYRPLCLLYSIHIIFCASPCLSTIT